MTCSVHCINQKGCLIYAFNEQTSVCQFGQRFRIQLASTKESDTMFVYSFPSMISRCDMISESVMTYIIISVPYPASLSLKALVITGHTAASTSGTGNPEIIDLEKPSAVCSLPNNLPVNISAAIGGVIDATSVFVCFGMVTHFSKKT